jgi:hypothetical protein
MPIRRTIIALLASALTLLLPGIALASPHAGALRACAAGKLKLRLDVSAAQKAAGGELASTVSMLAGTELAELQGAADSVCPRSAPAASRAQAKHLLSLYRHGSRARARNALRHLLSANRVHAHKSARSPLARLASVGCEFDGTVHVHPGEAPGVAADLAAAAAAQQGGDATGAREAMNAADRAYERWVAGGAGGAQSAGDWLAVAAGAQMLGLEALADGAIAHADRIATEALQACEKLDRCSLTSASAQSLLRTVAFAMLLGVETASDEQVLAPLLEAAQEVLAGNTPNGCEQWSLTARLTLSDGWGFSWGPGAFLVNRKTGVIADAPGVGAGWPGEVAAFSGPCTENGVVVGNGSVPAVPFHFNISGSVTPSGFALTLQSTNAHISVSVSGPPACQLLGLFGEQFVNAFLNSPVPAELPVTPGQTTASLVLPLEENAAITVTATRTH